jgi:putative transposase
MPRLARVIAVGVPHHVTQRGNARRNIFESDRDRFVYLNLVQDRSRLYALQIIGYCLMSNHVHLIVTPERPDSLPRVMRDAAARYAAYVNAQRETTGHLWQGRYYSCPMDDDHLWTALRYVERNPVRAGMVAAADDHPWSSARLHCEGAHADGFVHLRDWRSRWTASEWREYLHCGEITSAAEACRIRESTRTGRPLGSAEFVQYLESELGRRLAPGKGGRPKKPGNEVPVPRFYATGPCPAESA